jgi:hypothetical protein
LRVYTCVAQEFIPAAALWALLAIMQRRRYSVIGSKSNRTSRTTFNYE